MKYKKISYDNNKHDVTVNGTSTATTPDGMMFLVMKNRIKKIMCRPAHEFPEGKPDDVLYAVQQLELPTVHSYFDNRYVYLRTIDNMYCDLGAKATNMLNSTKNMSLRQRVLELASRGFTCSFYVGDELMLYAVRHNETGEYQLPGDIKKDSVLRPYMVETAKTQFVNYDLVSVVTDIKGYDLYTENETFSFQTDWYKKKQYYQSLSAKEVLQCIIDGDTGAEFSSEYETIGEAYRRFLASELEKATQVLQERILNTSFITRDEDTVQRCKALKIPYLSSAIIAGEDCVKIISEMYVKRFKS